MRILLTANASYVPPRGGATRSNLIWLDHMANAGHQCRIVAGATGEGAELRFHASIAAFAVEDPARRIQVLRQQIREFQPDWVLVSSEDLGHGLLREAQHYAHGRVVYLAHTPQFFPFGPASWNPNREAAGFVAEAAGVVAIGHHMAGYIERALGRSATVIHPPIYGDGPFADYANFQSGLVTMINPCAIKGLSIFLETAARLPDVEFGVVPGWGTTSEDRRALERLPNVRILPNAPNIDDVLARTRVLLMPSLWYEGFGLIVMESMLRGIPVVASDAGGLVEAKHATGFIIPVKTIQEYQAIFDEHAMPRPVVPANDPEPWVDALRLLLSDREVYASESQASRAAAHRFIATLDAADMEHYLASLKARPEPPQPRDDRIALAGKESAPIGTPTQAEIQLMRLHERKPFTAETQRRRGKRREHKGIQTRRSILLMRILLAQNSLYYPAHGGGDKSNRLLLEALAALGHECRVVARIPTFGGAQESGYLATLAARHITPNTYDGVVSFTRNGVFARIVTNANLRATFAAEIAAFQPDVILASTDDPAQLLLEPALRSPARVVYLARATLAVPFGPDCAFPSEAKTARIRACDAVVGVSQYVADYIRRYAGIPAVHVPISLMEPEEWPFLARFDSPYVTFVNPCAVKGIAIFLGLAGAFPETQFAAVPTWGTNQQDLAALRALPNITLIDPVDDINLLLGRTRVLLVPSLWAEARSRIVLESLLRGVPVLAANVGGIPEAMMGVPYLLPVNPITHYETRVDEQMVPVAQVPPQDIAPWRDALSRLLTDPAHYDEIAAQSRRAALEYASGLHAGHFEKLLYGGKRAQPAPAPAAEPVARPAHEALSPEKRKLLALRLRKQATPESWFPNVAAASGPRLFCFPHAGGGSRQSYKLACWTAVPVLLPGRESRLAEAAYERMQPLVTALADNLDGYTDRPFGFFGHSMGAAVAFELTRELRRRGRPLPRILIASGARAPQFRRNHVPQPRPTRESLIADLRALGGVSDAVLDHPAFLRVLLPSLEADVVLYRNYIYSEDEPLPIPIRAYGGLSDRNVTRAHLDAWAEQTTATFAVRTFPGGHFYLTAEVAAVTQALDEDLPDVR